MDTARQDGARTKIARKVRALREDRRWTQAELAKRLGLSQSRLSEIERGQGSFTAEQFLEILKLFNVAVTEFASARRSQSTELQNTLARLGATHLQESPDALPSDQLKEVGDVVREVLVSPESPRHVASLAPVLVRNIDRLSLNRLQGQLAESGFERRLAWLVDNVVDAIRTELASDLPRNWAVLCRRAEVVLDTFLTLDLAARIHPARAKDPPDILDRDILSPQTLDHVLASRSAISRRWGVATSLQPEDFVHALRAARVAG
jgi:transcriptional regulator with XRE-family HTH domain